MPQTDHHAGMTPQDARVVSEYLLNKTGIALSNGDADTFESCFLLPQDMDTFAGRRTITTAAEVRSIFHAVREHFERTGITELFRHCVNAQFIDENTVEATHESRLLYGAILQRAPYPVFSILRRVDGDWKIAFSQYAIADSSSHNAALMAAGDNVPEDPA